VNKTLVILNPAARSDKAARFQKQIRDLSADFVLHTTSEFGEARRVASQGVVDGFETIVAAGGDGTINEVVNGLGGSTVRLGILPTLSRFLGSVQVCKNRRQVLK
jgi:diacylglycerol kinase family enzyme